MPPKRVHSLLMLRFGAYLADTVLVAVFVLAGNAMLPTDLHQQRPEVGGFLALGLIILWFWVPEALWGATLGKRLAKIRVVDRAGHPPGFLRAAARTLLRVIEVNPLLAGGLPAYLVFRFTKHGQRLGDLLAGTFVVRSRQAEDLRRGAFDLSSLTPRS